MVDAAEEPADPGGLVTIRRYLYPIQAEWARNILASVGISCALPDHHADYLASLTKGVRVQVAEENAGEAESVLKECEFEIGMGQTLDHEEYAGEDELPPGTEPSEQFEPSKEAPQIADLGDLASNLVPKACPKCGGIAVRPAPPPDYAAESLLGAFLKRLAGRGWYRCLGCGHTWETGPGRQGMGDGEAGEP